MFHRSRFLLAIGLVSALPLTPGIAHAAQQAATGNSKSEATAAAVTPTVPADYVIGAQDVLSIVFWREKEMSSEVIVRPDGKISLPLLNEIQAAGFTPEQLRARINDSASKFVQDPNASVVVKDIRSRSVFITGSINKPGTVPLINTMNVLQLIALAGGLQEFADAKNIKIIRIENGRQEFYKFNYKEVVNQKNIEQNIMLKPGDTIVVP